MLLRQVDSLLRKAAQEGLDTASQKMFVDMAVQSATHFQFYSIISLESKRCSFLAVVLAHDLGALCELAFTLMLPCHNDLLNILLTIDAAMLNTIQQRTTPVLSLQDTQ